MNTEVRQQALSLVLTVREGRAAKLDELLREREAAVRAALGKVPSLHFGRIVVLPPEPGDGPHQLAFESNFDGELAAHLAELRAALGRDFDEIFGACEDFPIGADAKQLHRFVSDHALRAEAFYAAHPGLSVSVIRNDAAVRGVAVRWLDERQGRGGLRGVSALALAGELREHVVRVAAPAAGLYVGPVERWLPPAGSVWSLLAARLPEVLAAFSLAPLFELWDFFRARQKPSFDTPELRRRRDRIGLEEDRFDQNGLTHLVPIKAGGYRLEVLKLTLSVVDALARLAAREGRLGGLETIHFARWLILPDRRLLFFSNYDGSWEAYLGDFIDKVSTFLTLIWTNAVWFPQTWFLAFRGARAATRFKRWTRRYQLPTAIWYSAYPELSARNVLANARLRELLAGELDERRAKELLALL